MRRCRSLMLALVMTGLPVAAFGAHGFTPGLWMLTSRITGIGPTPIVSTRPSCLRHINQNIGYKGAANFNVGGNQNGIKMHIKSHGDQTTVTSNLQSRIPMGQGVEIFKQDLHYVFTGIGKRDKLRGKVVETTIEPHGGTIVMTVLVHGHWVRGVCPAHLASPK